MDSAASQSPCYAVIFSSRRTAGDHGYAEAAAELVRLAEAAPGFLGAQSVRQEDGQGITVSYWDSLESIARFKADPRHVAVRARMADWYEEFGLRVCRVERETFWKAHP
ncbi:antibiotic biosynthesis monooxygenase family protein [Humidesulfovibrio idahonensis]